MYHYTYLLRLKNSDSYYVGRHSTTDLDDGYKGSGRWPSSIKDRSRIVVEILEFHETLVDAKLAEEKLLGEHIGNDNNMNFNNRSCGFSSGDLNPMRNPEIAAKNAAAQRGVSRGEQPNHWTKNPSNKERVGKAFRENNPTQNPEIMKRIAKKTSARMQVSNPMFNPEVRKLVSETGNFAKNNPSKIQVECPHCGTIGGGGTMKMWHFDNCRSKDK